MILELVKFHELILNVLQRLEFIPDEEPVAQWQHAKVNSLESESFSPLPTNRRRQLRFQSCHLPQEVVDFMIQHILLFLSLTARSSRMTNAVSFILHLLRLVKLEELFYFRHLEVVVAHCPNQPVEVLLKLKILPSDNNALERNRPHISESSAHLNLFLQPVAVSECQQTDHQFNFSVRLNLL